jgi:hypothetical protein
MFHPDPSVVAHSSHLRRRKRDLFAHCVRLGGHIQAFLQATADPLPSPGKGPRTMNTSPDSPMLDRGRLAEPRRWTRRIAMSSVVAIAGALCVIAAPAAVQAADPFVPIAGVPLGLVQSFGVLTPAAVGNAAGEPPTVIRGDLGAGGAITGFPPGIITGTVSTGTAIASMMTDLQTAYDNARTRPAGTPLPALLEGTNIGPGVHSTAAATGTTAGGSFTIDGEGHPDAVFIFQVGGALALGANTTITLINGAQAKNVFWQVVGAGGIGATTQFVGTLIAGTAVSSGAGSTINGRLTSLTGAVTMGSTQLYSAPPTVSIDGGDEANTTSSTPMITGVTSARSPMTVTVTIDGTPQLPAVTPSSSGVWSFQSPLLINGDHVVAASSVDGAGNVGSFSQILTVDTTPPVVTIDGGAISATNDLTPTITGSTDIAPGEPVSVTMTMTTPPVTTVRTAIVQADQTWNITPNNTSAGAWTITATVADPAGNTSTATQVLTIDATAPVAAITSAALTNDPTPTITGTAEVGATTTVTIDGLAVATVTLGGSWSATATVGLLHGNHNVAATATDTVGNSTVLVQTLNVDLVLPLVSIDPGIANSSSDPTPTLAGTTDVAVGATVHVSIDGGSPLAALVQSDGWNVTPSGNLSSGVHTIVATVADPAGNVGSFTQTLTIDTTAPTVIIDGGSSRTTRDATPTITGSSPDVPLGSSVTVEVAGQVLTTSTDADGEFSVTAAAITPIDPITLTGTYFVFVTVIDAAGNDGVANQSLTINATPPTVTYTNGTVVSTNDATPLISGTTNAAVGSPVVVTVATQTLHATVQPGGSWNVTAAALATGDVTVVASITDPYGNVGSATQTLTVDSTTATIMLITGGASVATNDDTPMISGTTDAADGRVVTVTVAGQTKTVSTTAGTWAVTADHITDGTYTVTASIGAGGNPGSTTQLLMIDTVAPVVIIGGGGTVQTTDPTPAISGSGAAPASTITVVVAGQTMTTTAGLDGTWSVTPPTPLPAGNNPVTVTVTDPAGNTSTGSQTITVVVEATTITITGGMSDANNDDTPTISGSTNAANGRVLTVTISTQTIVVTIIGGAWSVNAAHLADGTYTVTASVSVNDGTPAASSQSLNIDTIDPVVVIPPPVETNDTTPAITGSGVTPGSTITVTVAGETMTTTAGSDGTWSVTPTHPLPAGTNAVTLTVTDAAGNTGTGTRTITVTAPPAALPDPPVTDPEAGDDFNSVGPKRVFDTRAGQSPNALRQVVKQQISGTNELEVKMTDIAGFVPAGGVGAVSLNVTSTESAAAGFLTVYACGTRELVSSVNFPAGKTVANAVIAPVSANGTVCFYANAPTDIIVDINGWFAAGAAFNAVGPKRVFDTRPGNSPDAMRAVTKSKLTANSMIEVRLTDLVGYAPAAGVSSVSLNVVVTEPEAAGFLTVYSCGSRELVSSVNFAAGQTVANAVIAPVSSTGTVCFYTLATAHLIVDINGWLEAGSGFTGVDPARILDTRGGESPDAARTVAKAKIGGGNVLQVQVTDLAGLVPAGGVTAVSLNVTATNTEGAGYVSVFACGTMEEVSSLNYEAGSTVANAVLAPVSAGGTICLYSNQRTDVIVDINGWIGAP